MKEMHSTVKVYEIKKKEKCLYPRTMKSHMKKEKKGNKNGLARRRSKKKRERD